MGNRKRITAIVLAAIMLALPACGNKSEVPSGKEVLADSESREVASTKLDSLMAQPAYQNGDVADRAQLLLSELSSLEEEGEIMAGTVFYDEEHAAVTFAYKNGLTASINLED